MRHLLAPIEHTLLGLGPVGLFFLALMDSSSIPAVPEVLMIRLALQHPHKLWLYALLATAGSLVGSLILFGVARYLGSHWVEKKMPRKRFLRIHASLEQYDVFAVAVPAMLPPPFPFKLFVLAAGVFEISWMDFAASMAVGRGIRYFAEGYLAVRYGSQAWGYVRHHTWAVAFAAVLLIALGYWMGRIRRRPVESDPQRATSNE